MSLFCASHIREKKTHTHREREREKERRNCQHRSLAGGKERERETNLDWKTASKQPKRNERDFREKNKSKEEEKTL